MPRRPIGTNRWLALAACFALAVWAASSSIGAPWAPHEAPSPGSPLALAAPAAHGPAIEAANPGRPFLDTECSGIIEESEGEGFDWSAIDAAPAFFPPVDPSRLLPAPPPGRSLSRMLVPPLRC